MVPKLAQAILGLTMILAIVGLVYMQHEDTQAVKAQVAAIASTPSVQQDIQLPEDGQAYFTSVIVRKNWRQSPRDRELVAWFEQDARLASLKAQTHWRIYEQDDPLFRKNLGHVVGGFPAMVIQDSTGRVVYSAWDGAGQLAQASSEVGNEVGRIFGRLRPCPDGGCPKPEPKPTPDTDIDVNVVPKPIVPNIEPPKPVETPKEEEFPWVVLVLAVIASGLGSLAINFSREVRR